VIRAGEPWGEPATDPPERTVTGCDADLAHAIDEALGTRLWFRPVSSDLARAIGLAPDASEPGSTELPLDLLRAVTGDETGAPVVKAVVNAAVIGTRPDRLRWSTRRFHAEISIDGRVVFSGRTTTVVIANGQFLHGLDVVPRGHPGDGRAEVQAYSLSRSQRRLMQRRLATGTHVPHPDISQWTGRRVELHVSGRSVPAELDGVAVGSASSWSFTVEPAAYRLLA
jgi:hypothetical protein